MKKYKREGASSTPTYEVQSAILSGCRIISSSNDDGYLTVKISCEKTDFVGTTVSSYYLSYNELTDIDCGKSLLTLEFSWMEDDEIDDFIRSLKATRSLELSSFSFVVGGGTFRVRTGEKFEVNTTVDNVYTERDDWGYADVNIVIDGSGFGDIYDLAENENDYEESLQHRLKNVEKKVVDERIFDSIRNVFKKKTLDEIKTELRAHLGYIMDAIQLDIKYTSGEDIAWQKFKVGDFKETYQLSEDVDSIKLRASGTPSLTKKVNSLKKDYIYIVVEAININEKTNTDNIKIYYSISIHSAIKPRDQVIEGSEKASKFNNKATMKYIAMQFSELYKDVYKELLIRRVR